MEEQAEINVSLQQERQKGKREEEKNATPSC